MHRVHLPAYLGTSTAGVGGGGGGGGAAGVVYEDARNTQ